MKRLLITGKNCELSREAFSRAARLADASSLHTGRAAFHSGAAPESAAGGSRASSSKKEDTRPEGSSLFECSSDLEPPQPRLEVHQALGEVGMMLLVSLLAVACMVVGWL